MYADAVRIANNAGSGQRPAAVKSATPPTPTEFAVESIRRWWTAEVEHPGPRPLGQGFPTADPAAEHGHHRRGRRPSRRTGAKRPRPAPRLEMVPRRQLAAEVITGLEITASGRAPAAAPSEQPAAEPERVSVHDFADRALGEFAKAIPYGVYDVANNAGWVNVGDSADTAEFAVESIRRWWNTLGRDRFPTATRLLITADAGGSNGYRPRAWKWFLAR